MSYFQLQTYTLTQWLTHSLSITLIHTHTRTHTRTHTHSLTHTHTNIHTCCSCVILFDEVEEFCLDREDRYGFRVLIASKCHAWMACLYMLTLLRDSNHGSIDFFMFWIVAWERYGRKFTIITLQQHIMCGSDPAQRMTLRELTNSALLTTNLQVALNGKQDAYNCYAYTAQWASTSSGPWLN